MFSKRERLPREEFSKLARYRGEQAALPYFLVKIKQNTVGHNRFGVVVGIAVHKKAARRNFLKRRIREIIARWPEAGADVLVVARPPSAAHARDALSCLSGLGAKLKAGR